jgi:hypothetical protein
MLTKTIFLLLFSVAPVLAQTKINYDGYDRLLKTYINEQGAVNYVGMKKDFVQLQAFIQNLSEVSPENHPEIFADKNEKLRYYATAYNAWTLYHVTKNYPKKDTMWGKLLFKDKPIVLGNQKLTLNDLEHKILRSHFQDPRVHFYINCAARSCPPLQQGAIPAGKTDEILERSAHAFINNKKYVTFDPVAKKLQISKIFDWFEGDFLTYLKTKKGIQNPHISQYLLLFLEGEAKEALGKLPVNEIKVSHFDYDRSLNEG